jgi:hypothetical protein
VNQEASFPWTHAPGQQVSLLHQGDVLLRYRIATDRRKPFLHPVSTTDGIVLTEIEPADHVWHRGVWFSWKYINGVNYWEENPDGRGDGITEFVAPEQVRFDAGKATITTRLRYRPPDGAVILEERREIVLCVPREDGNYTMDWRHEFRAQGQRVVLDRTPICAETPWGGYAGVSWRAALSLSEFRVLDSEGRTGEATNAQRARWADLTGVTADGRAAGIAMFDHPGNPRHPTYWRTIIEPGFGYLNPAFVLAEPFTLDAGGTLRLRYRVLIHRGRADATLLEREYCEFAR